MYISVYNSFLKTRLTFAVTLNVKKLAPTMGVFNIKLKSARVYTILVNILQIKKKSI